MVSFVIVLCSLFWGVGGGERFEAKSCWEGCEKFDLVNFKWESMCWSLNSALEGIMDPDPMTG